MSTYEEFLAEVNATIARSILGPASGIYSNPYTAPPLTERNCIDMWEKMRAARYAIYGEEVRGSQAQPIGRTVGRVTGTGSWFLFAPGPAAEDFLTDYGAGRHASLDAWAKMIGMPGKLDCSGADVAQMMADGRLSDVQSYCMADVAQTHAVRLRLELVRGMSSDRYRTAMQSLIDAIHVEPKLSALYDAMDKTSRLMHVHGEVCT